MNKKAAITGGSRGIGRGIVRRLAKDGYDISFTYSSERGKVQAEALVKEIKEKYRVKCFAHQAALNEKGEAEKFVQKAYHELEGLDLLVCNAGQSLVNSIYEMDEKTIDFLINLDFRSYLMAAREAGRIMGENKIKGNIIFISSCRGIRAYPYDELYGGLKAGLIRSIQTFALDLAPYGIRANCISPGPIRVRTSEEMREEGVCEQEIEDLDNLWKQLPLERMGTPEDIANAVSFIASEQASYITGANLVIDGAASLPGIPENRPKDDEEFKVWCNFKRRW
ncbi:MULTISPECIES: SDR family NAD(P)-dependent oxidoreductase [Mediterraneibacter]|jgi:glucose 1-dehydrogenase|uniref:SDR family NAD(P)-dependent oxidoreductase n=1 Tax=Mediterraneibacter TaxID=2316020 RepID=UPI000E4991B8|nr:SDR family oxidoreductase [Mediterraneibacter massiliensis]RGT71035.1 SDR family NAD(P)-dependent oxidoreductase [Ruminococcus sp. AF18-22]